MTMAIEVLPIGPVAMAARVWRHRGRRLFTTIVKATFNLAPDGPMTPIAPLPIVTEERHHRNNPVASLVRGSDLALTVPKPEVVVVGSAYAGRGRTTPQLTVRLAVQRDTKILVNKRLEVFGDRRAKPGAPPPDAASFTSIPIVYERARGGMAARENPVGIGMAIDPDGLLTLPNINLPAQAAGPHPAGLGPIPSAWPLRQKRRGSLSWTDANLSLDVDVPDDFDDAYYQTAPADQQTTELLPGDLVAIVNMHPDQGMLRTTLPAARGVALAQTARGDRIPLHLRIDTVHIEPDALRAEIVYRGAAVIAEEDLRDLRLAGTLEQPEAPYAFPDLTTLSGLVARRSDAGSRQSLETTAVIDEPISPALREAGMRALRDSAPPPAPFERVGRAGTMIMEPDPAPTPEPAPMPADRRASTVIIEAEVAPRSLPFDKRGRPQGGARSATTDATPWGKPGSTPPPVLFDEPTTEIGARRRDPLQQTLPLDEHTASADSDTATPKLGPPEPEEPPPPARRTPQPIEEKRVDEKQKPASPWREPDPPPPPPPPKPAPQPRANLKQDLYKKLKR